MKVRMHGVAREGAAQDVDARAHRIDAAAEAVRQGDHAVDVRIIGEYLRMDIAPEIIGDGARNGRRAIHTREDTDVITRRDPPVFTANAHERGGLVDETGRVLVDTEYMFALELRHAEIVDMHVLAWRN